MDLVGAVDNHSLQPQLGLASAVVHRCDRAGLSRDGRVFGRMDGALRIDDQKTASPVDALINPALCTGSSRLGWA